MMYVSIEQQLQTRECAHQESERDAPLAVEPTSSRMLIVLCVCFTS